MLVVDAGKEKKKPSCPVASTRGIQRPVARTWIGMWHTLLLCTSCLLYVRRKCCSLSRHVPLLRGQDEVDPSLRQYEKYEKEMCTHLPIVPPAPACWTALVLNGRNIASKVRYHVRFMISNILLS